MTILRPFKAVRPREDLANKVAALPYDVLNSEEAREVVKNNDYSFLHVDKAEIDLDKNINIYDNIVYNKAKDNLYNMIDKKVLIEDNKRCLYIYKLIMDKREQVGIVGCTSIDDYISDKIKKHEHTREEKEIDRINHVDICDANTGPIFLTYRYNSELSDIIKMWMEKDPIYNFKAEDEVEHIAWIIDDEHTIDNICNIFNNINSIYIADGHHRAASAVKVGLKRRRENPNYNGNEEFNFFLSVLFPHSDLSIMDYNRIIKDLNGLSTEEYMLKISERFDISIYEGEGAYKPSCEHTYGMYISGKWYKLTAKRGTYDHNNLVDRLDVSILQDNLLKPILGIEDPRTDQRIDFIGGIRGLKELEMKVDQETMGVGFSMYPAKVQDLMDIADIGEVMPPKSTWFEPKLRSGLFIHKLR